MSSTSARTLSLALTSFFLAHQAYGSALSEEDELPQSWTKGTLEQAVKASNSLEKQLLLEDLLTRDFPCSTIAELLELDESSANKTNNPKSAQPLNNGNRNQSLVRNDHELATILQAQEKDDQQFLNDHSLAMALSQQEDENNNNKPSFWDDQFSSDHSLALALKLQQEENNQAYNNANNYHQKQLAHYYQFESPQEREKFQNAVKCLTTYKDNMNVHDYNKQHVTPHKGVIISVADKMKLNKNIPVDQIIQAIEGGVDDMELYPDLKTAFTHIKEHANGQVEPETGVKIEEILSMVWDLHNKMDGDMNNAHQFQYGNVVGGSLSLIVHKIQENVNAQGGCKAGYAGRLIEVLAMLERAYAI